MLKYKFFVLKNEKRIEVDKPFDMLSDLSNCSLSDIDEAVECLQQVIDEKLDFYSFGGSDYCIIDSAQLESLISYDFGNKEITIETKHLLDLMKDYQEFYKSSR